MWSLCTALPARLGHAGDVALVGSLAQADPAEAEFAVVGARAAAAAATGVRPAFVLVFAALADLLGSLGHLGLTLLGGALARLVVALGGLALVGLGLGVRLGVLLFQFFEGGLLGFALQPRLLFFFLFLGGFFFLFALGLAGTALLRERHAEPQEQVECLEDGRRRGRHRHGEAADDIGAR